MSSDYLNDAKDHSLGMYSSENRRRYRDRLARAQVSALIAIAEQNTILETIVKELATLNSTLENVVADIPAEPRTEPDHVGKLLGYGAMPTELLETKQFGEAADGISAGMVTRVFATAEQAGAYYAGSAAARRVVEVRELPDQS